MLQGLRQTYKGAIAAIYRQALALTVSHPVASRPTIRIQASRGLGSLQLREIWEYRDLIYFLVWCEIKGRYRQMALGPLWVIIQPFFTVITSTVIFSVIAKLPSDGLPYPLFNYAALLPWTFFSGAVSRAAGSLMGYQHLISKVYFPRLIIPIVCILSGLMDFFISFAVLLIVAGLYGFWPSPPLLLMPVFLALAAATALAIGLWIAALMAQFRDVGVLLGYFLQAWMYATPILYPANLIPDSWQFVYYLNPMAGVVTGFRWAVLGRGDLPLLPVCLSMLGVGCLLVSGAYYFRSTERSIVDII